LLTPYTGKISGDHQCGFWHKRPATAHIFCICHIQEKKWKYNGRVHQLFIDFEVWD
jgi:hypothetical protein